MSALHTQHIDLSHQIVDGMTTYPGLPAPKVRTHLGRDAAEEIYGPGVRFHIGMVDICTNTGTYIDVPFHRFDAGHDLASLALERVAAVPAVCIDVRDQRSITIDPSDLQGLKGHAVLFHTDHSLHFGTPAYNRHHPFLTARSARALVSADVACVGIDSLNVDDTDDVARPVHTALLAADIPIIEHLTNLAALPASGFTFTAVPPRIAGAGTFTVRAFATLGPRRG